MRALCLGVVLAVAAIVAGPAAAATTSEQDAARQLAERYAPIVVVRDQSEPCDRDGEAYRPVPVETVLDTPDIVLLDGDGNVVAKGPSAQDLAGQGPETSLDFPGNPRRPGCGFEEDFHRLGAGRPDVAYAHVAHDPAAPDRDRPPVLVLLVLRRLRQHPRGRLGVHPDRLPGVARPRQALAATPLEVGLLAALGRRAGRLGRRQARARRATTRWSTRASGSHANFFTSDLFLGRSADEGFGCDDTTGPSTRLPTEARAAALRARPTRRARSPGCSSRAGGASSSRRPTTRRPARRPRRSGAPRSRGRSRCATPASRSPPATRVGPTATGAFCSLVKVGGRIYTAVTLAGRAPADRRSGFVSVGRRPPARPDGRRPCPTRCVRRRASGQILRDALGLYRQTPPPAARPRRALRAGGHRRERRCRSSCSRSTSLGDAGRHGRREQPGVGRARAPGGAGAGHLVAAAIVLGGVAGAVADGRRGATGRRARRLPRCSGAPEPRSLGVLGDLADGRGDRALADRSSGSRWRST